jgi:biotin carboxyl carrier protein
VNEQGEVTAPSVTPVKVMYQRPIETSATVEKITPKPVETQKAVAVAEGDAIVNAPMPGMIVDYYKKVGDAVKAGETILVIEAMKMNNNIDAPCDGVIKEIPYSAGDSVGKGAVLAVITKE